MLMLTGVYRGQVFGFISVSLLVLRPPARRSSWWVRETGGSKSGVTGRLSPSVI
jgi:hypothetical protein